jgi:SAM-dependent methyltransferase
LSFNKIKFVEQKKSLSSRVLIHSVYSKKDMIKWIYSLIPYKKKYKILDLACGDGKQTFKLSKYLKGGKINFQITACDINQDLIQVAKKNKVKNIKYKILDFNKKFPSNEKHYDLVLCIFGIYYAKSFKKVLYQILNSLNKDGLAIFVGPLRNNKLDFNNHLSKAIGEKIPKLLGSARFDSIFFNETKRVFRKTKLIKFENKLKINNKNDYLEYAKNSISLERGVYSQILNKKNYTKILENLENIINNNFKKNKYLTITKKIGAIIAKK